MARYKYIDTNPRFLPVDLARQLLLGTFEHALNYLLDHAIDLSSFDGRFRNDETGATAYPSAMLLKVVLFAYSQGIVSSRGIERVCREHVTFIALCGDTSPHFTTIAHFVSTLGEDIARVFAAVVAICDAQGLIGRERLHEHEHLDDPRHHVDHRLPMQAAASDLAPELFTQSEERAVCRPRLEGVFLPTPVDDDRFGERSAHLSVIVRNSPTQSLYQHPTTRSLWQGSS
jgi:hypothetical protein